MIRESVGFFAVDPLTKDYPHNSPYAFAENNVIQFIELEGGETGEATTTAASTFRPAVQTVGKDVTKELAKQAMKNAMIEEGKFVLKKKAAESTVSKIAGKTIGFIASFLLMDYMSPNYGGRTSEMPLPNFKVDEKIAVPDYLIKDKSHDELPIVRLTQKGKDDVTPKIRLRHYTSNQGLQGIKEDMTIEAYDQNKVFAEKAKRKPLSVADAADKYGIQKKDARNYIEFEVDASRVNVSKNSVTGVTEYTIKGDVKLNSTTTKFVKRN